MPYKDKELRNKYRREYYYKRKEAGTLIRYKTSKESHKKSISKIYAKYTVSMRRVEDADLIAYLESEKEAGRSPTVVLRNLYESYKKSL